MQDYNVQKIPLDQIERSMAANPRNAHGAHIKAHVLYEMGEDKKGLDYLEGWLPAYAREGMMHCHISWHVAMFAMILGDLDKAWRIYRAQVRPGGALGPALNVATDAPAFLWRAELAGHWASNSAAPVDSVSSACRRMRPCSRSMSSSEQIATPTRPTSPAASA